MFTSMKEARVVSRGDRWLVQTKGFLFWKDLSSFSSRAGAEVFRRHVVSVREAVKWKASSGSSVTR